MVLLLIPQILFGESDRLIRYTMVPDSPPRTFRDDNDETQPNNTDRFISEIMATLKQPIQHGYGGNKKGKGWQLVIEDNSRGIPREDLDRIFEPFIQQTGIAAGSAFASMPWKTS